MRAEQALSAARCEPRICIAGPEGRVSSTAKPYRYDARGRYLVISQFTYELSNARSTRLSPPNPLLELSVGGYRRLGRDCCYHGWSLAATTRQMSWHQRAGKLRWTWGTAGAVVRLPDCLRALWTAAYLRPRNWSPRSSSRLRNLSRATPCDAIDSQRRLGMVGPAGASRRPPVNGTSAPWLAGRTWASASTTTSGRYSPRPSGT